ncbi:MAG: hypothetical protein CMQ51_00615 [Gammaproteobacteria bacterium]|nr:hypothetical protein [Gammaproteobacteria bacterium]|tara:strand:- start:196 stop:468 length:273 start_codon:yes stop_codon:yes gene_type:complete
MGIAIANHIVQAHGGVIWSENAPETGATISFTLLRAGYMLLILEAGKIHVDYRRLDYNVSAVTQAVRDNGIPDQFASQLEADGEEILVSV